MATEPDFGSDFHCESDLDADLSVVSGLRGLAEGLVRRLQTSELFYDKAHGTDLRKFLNGTYAPGDIQRAAENECLKDERVDRVRSSCELNGETARLTLVVTTGRGPFRLVIAVASLTVEMLDFMEL